MVEATEEPVVEATEEPVVEATEEPVVETTEEPVVEATEEPAVEPTEEPTEEPVVEPTEEPTVEDMPVVDDMPVVEDEPIVEETPVPGVEGEVEIYLVADGDIYIGDTVKLVAEVEGYTLAYTLQWQYNDGSDWKDVEGETDDELEIEVTEENAAWAWRIAVIAEEAA